MYYVPYMYPYDYHYIYQPYYPYVGNSLYWDERGMVNNISNIQPPRFVPRIGKGHYLLIDYGPNPFVININEASKQNNSYRDTLWTGSNLQVTLMSINVGEDIGLEVHPHVDQFLRVEEGQGIVQMGKSKDNLNFERQVSDDTAIIVPAGTWHNVTNTGHVPLKLYSIYAPPNHPFGTIDVTKADATAREESYRHGN